jgi:biotin carboxyl carrier protein
MTTRRYTVEVDGHSFAVEIDDGAGALEVRVDGEPIAVEGRVPRAGAGTLLVGAAAHDLQVGKGTGALSIAVDGETFEVRVRAGTGAAAVGGEGTAAAGAGQRLVAPMPGKVVAVLVEPGQAVEPGAGLVVLEAMKMENEFRATVAGTVTEVAVRPGQAVNAGDVLVVIG